MFFKWFKNWFQYINTLKNILIHNKESHNIEGEIDNILNDIRNISHNLMPIDFSEYDLTDIIRQTINKFKNNPTKYLPQYGGYCAFGVSVGAKFRADPNKFVVKDGKYFLFLYDLEVDAQQLWLDGNHEKLVAKADGNWTKLSKEQ